MFDAGEYRSLGDTAVKRASQLIAVTLALCFTLSAAAVKAQVFLNPSETFSPKNYPSGSVERGEEGVAVIALNVGRDGLVKKCEITSSSGYADLDEATCRLMLEKAKFDVSAFTDAVEIPNFKHRVRWSAPITAPRALFLGVTVRETPSKIESNKIRCDYSDGKVRYVAYGSTCARALPTYYGRNIIDEYISDFKRNNSADSAMSAGLLLIENEYSKGFYYIEQSSARGSSIASSVLCSLYSNEAALEYGKFNPNQALEYCILSYNQNYSDNVVSLSNQIYARYGSRLDRGVYERAKSVIVVKKLTQFPKFLTPLTEVIRPKDYPSRDNNKDVGGKTGVLLLVSDQGKVQSCIVTQSTYSFSLDQKVCSRMKEAAYLAPAEVNGQASTLRMTKATISWKPGVKTQDPASSILMSIIWGALSAAL